MVDMISHYSDFSKNSANPKLGLSYLPGSGKNPLVFRTIGQELSLVASEYGDKEAFVFVEENKRFTYGQLLKEADELAAGFQCLGLQKGDRVCILAPNVSTWTLVMFAAARAGLISVTLNPTYGTSDIEACLRKVSAKALVASENFGSVNYYEKLLKVIPELAANQSGSVKSKALPFLSAVIIDSEQKYSGILRLKDVKSLPTESQVTNIESQQKDISPYSGCNIQFTSGFTGSPKAVLLSHYGIINGGYNMHRFGCDGAKFCLVFPVCHVASLTLITIPSLCNRGTVVVPYFMNDPEKVLRAISTEQCTFISSLPKLFMDLVEVQKKLKLNINNNLIAVIGGTGSSATTLNEIKKELGLTLKIGFGMTEYSGIGFGSLPGDSDEQVLNTVGCPTDHVEVKVIDSNENIVPFGVPGELCVRSCINMIGYWEDEEKTKNILSADGWLRTGDYFVLQPNGYGKVLARIDELILKGKEKIVPSEIEYFLQTCPKVAEVYVVGVPDRNLGEELCAFIRPHDEFDKITSHDIYQFCKGKISSNHIPKYIQFVQDYPKTMSGKVKKLELKKQFLNSNKENF